MWTIRAVVLVAFLDLFMQVPVIATYARALGAGAAMVGAIVGMYSAANIGGNVGAGFLLDRMNRRWLVVAGMALTAAALLSYGFASSPPQLLVLRALHGLAAGALAPGAFAMLGDRTRSQHARSMGASGMLIAVSAVIGPPLSGFIRELWGYAEVFYVSGALMLCAALALALLVSDTRPDAARREPEEDPPAALRDPVLMKVYCLVLAMTYGIGALIGHLPLVIESAGGSSRMAGMAFAAFSLVASFIMASPIQRKIDDRSRSLAIRLGLGFIAVCGAGLAVGGGGAPSTFAAMAAFGVGFGLLFPSLGAAVSERADSRRRGIAFGVFYATYSVGVFLGSTISGAAYQTSGAVGAPFIVSAAICLAVLPIAYGFRRRG